MKGLLKMKDLRIGNIVGQLYEETNFENLHEVVVESLIDNKINGQLLAYYHPVPITEELLFKHGFKNESTRGYFDNGEIKIYKNHQVIWYPKIEYDHDGFHYLHQLQNWQFSLTNTEIS